MSLQSKASEPSVLSHKDTRSPSRPSSGLHSHKVDDTQPVSVKLPSHAPLGGSASPLRLEDLFAAETESPLEHAFPKKGLVHPFLAAQPVRQEDHQETWQTIGSTARTGKSVAYLHIPFCENHCLFCGFYQNPWRTNHSAFYADAVIKEIKAEKDSPLQASGPIHAVYFGGGTPTALESADLCRIIEAVRHYLPLASDCEITIEGRIFSFPLEKAKACFAAGANRISIGVQTFDTKLRKRLGRKVDGDQAQEFLRDLVALDQGAIVIDLMYGLPEQSLKSWERDVEWVTITKLAQTFSPIMGGALFLPPTGAAAPESATSTI